VLVLPIPSRPSADRVRGHSAGESMARAAVGQLPYEMASDVEVVQGLQLSHRVQDQSGLSRAQRGQNLAMAFTANHRQIPQLRSKPVVIVDDVVTTGSTLREAIRALNERGIEPIGLVAACRAQAV
jgi:predicted amidophosphoribosyltransferase